MAPEKTQRAFTEAMPVYPTAFMVLQGNTAGIVETPEVRIVPWPDNVPRQIYICRARAGHQANGKTAPFGQFGVSVNGRESFDSGVPPWRQLKPDGTPTWTESIGLISIFSGANDPQERTEHWQPPVFFDADKHLLWYQVDANDPNDEWWAQIGYEVPGPGVEIQPYPYVAAPPPPPPPPGPGWNTVTGPISFDGSSPGWAGYTFAMMVDPSAIAAMDNGSQVRASFSGAGLALDKVYVNDHACTVDGAGNWVAPIGLDRTAGMLWKAHVTVGALSTRATAMPGIHCSYKLGDDAATSGTVGYTASALSGVPCHVAMKLQEVLLP